MTEEFKCKFISIMKQYFSLTDAEVEECLKKKFRNSKDEDRLVCLITETLPYLKKYVNESDEKLKKKVGKVFLSKLDYDKFYPESVEGTRRRISKLFHQTTEKKINPYKIIYCSVLTDGNLKIDYERKSKYFDYTRDFDGLYQALKQSMGISDEETVAIFEKCSSLISKAYTFRFPQVFAAMANFKVTLSGYPYYSVFKKDEIVEILKINPTLFTIQPEKIVEVFKYLLEKVQPSLKSNLKPLHEDVGINYLENEVILLRSWLKNNSSLFSLNVTNMRIKERFLKVDFNNQFDQKFSKQIASFFNDPSMLSIMNQLPIEKIRKNAIKNVLLLQKYANESKIKKYMEENPLIVAIENANLNAFLEQISTIDKTSIEPHLMGKFFQSGKALFSNNLDFNVSTIMEKLRKNNSVIEVNIESLKNLDLVKSFVELFFSDDLDIFFEIENLISQKKARNGKGEMSIRRYIRNLGQEIKALPMILKDHSLSGREKKDKVISLAVDINQLNNLRFNLAEADKDFKELKLIEKENAKEIESMMNLLRDVYEQKRFKVGKIYSNCEKLYEEMMNYLGQCFDDKEAIYDLFNKEISENFVSAIKETYLVEKDAQFGMFGEKLHVGGVDAELRKPLKKMSNTIDEADLDWSGANLEFDK